MSFEKFKHWPALISHKITCRLWLLPLLPEFVHLTESSVWGIQLVCLCLRHWPVRTLHNSLSGRHCHLLSLCFIRLKCNRPNFIIMSARLEGIPLSTDIPINSFRIILLLCFAGSAIRIQRQAINNPVSMPLQVRSCFNWTWYKWISPLK